MCIHLQGVKIATDKSNPVGDNNPDQVMKSNTHNKWISYKQPLPSFRFLFFWRHEDIYEPRPVHSIQSIYILLTRDCHLANILTQLYPGLIVDGNQLRKKLTRHCTITGDECFLWSLLVMLHLVVIIVICEVISLLDDYIS